MENRIKGFPWLLFLTAFLESVQIQFRHQFIIDDGQKFCQFRIIFRRKTFFAALINGLEVSVVDVVVLQIFLSRTQMMFTLVLGRLNFFHITLLQKAADTICGIRSRDTSH